MDGPQRPPRAIRLPPGAGEKGDEVKRAILPVLVALTVGACGVPRGAALQSEILLQSDAEYPDIAVYAVTREMLPVFATWPETGDATSHGWLQHKPGAAEIRIRPFDEIDLVVWDAEDNSLLTAPEQKLVDMSGLRVTESGQVFVPYLGYLRVADRTPDGARRLVEREMSSIVPSAQVQLKVTPGTRGSVSLVSGVANPGSFPLPEGNFTVLDLIGLGGGAGDLRNPQVRLIRGGRTYMASLDSLLKSPARDTVLRGGDKVALVPDERYFRALGASGTEELVYFEKDEISALDAMSLIGGLLDSRANPQGILVMREYPPTAVAPGDAGPDNVRTVFTIDLTTSDGVFSAGRFPIQPGDTVMVTEALLPVATSLARLVGSGLGVSAALSN